MRPEVERRPILQNMSDKYFIYMWGALIILVILLVLLLFELYFEHIA